VGSRIRPYSLRLTEIKQVSARVKDSNFGSILESYVHVLKDGRRPGYQELRMRVRIIDPRPDALRGEETPPSFYFSTAGCLMGSLRPDTSSVLVLPPTRKQPEKKNPDWTSDTTGYQQGSGGECFEPEHRGSPFPDMACLGPLRRLPPCLLLDFPHFAGYSGLSPTLREKSSNGKGIRCSLP
jgi:hypothetical protein